MYCCLTSSIFSVFSHCLLVMQNMQIKVSRYVSCCFRFVAINKCFHKRTQCSPRRRSSAFSVLTGFASFGKTCQRWRTDQINYGVDGYSPEKKLSWKVRDTAKCVVIVKTSNFCVNFLKILISSPSLLTLLPWHRPFSVSYHFLNVVYTYYFYNPRLRDLRHPIRGFDHHVGTKHCS